MHIVNFQTFFWLQPILTAAVPDISTGVPNIHVHFPIPTASSRDKGEVGVGRRVSRVFHPDKILRKKSKAQIGQWPSTVLLNDNNKVEALCSYIVVQTVEIAMSALDINISGMGRFSHCGEMDSRSTKQMEVIFGPKVAHH